MVIKNSAPVPHNAKWVSQKNDEINPLLPAGGQYVVEEPSGGAIPDRSRVLDPSLDEGVGASLRSSRTSQ